MLLREMGLMILRSFFWVPCTCPLTFLAQIARNEGTLLAPPSPQHRLPQTIPPPPRRALAALGWVGVSQEALDISGYMIE